MKNAYLGTAIFTFGFLIGTSSPVGITHLLFKIVFSAFWPFFWTMIFFNSFFQAGSSKNSAGKE